MLPLASATRSASLLTARVLGSGTIPPITESVVSQAVSDGSSREVAGCGTGAAGCTGDTPALERLAPCAVRLLLEDPVEQAA